jgi:hypothetical protein
MSDLKRNVAEIDMRSDSWASEEHLVEYVVAFFTRGGISASRVLRNL